MLWFWSPHHYESAAVSLIPICVQTLQRVFTSKREKKTQQRHHVFVWRFFFTDKSRRWHVGACHRGTVLGNQSIYMTSKRTFEHLLFCARWGDRQKVASFLFTFIFLKENLLNPPWPPTFFLCSHLLHPSFILVFHIRVLTSGSYQQLAFMRRAAAIRGRWTAQHERLFGDQLQRKFKRKCSSCFFVLFGSVLSRRWFP